MKNSIVHKNRIDIDGYLPKKIFYHNQCFFLNQTNITATKTIIKPQI